LLGLAVLAACRRGARGRSVPRRCHRVARALAQLVAGWCDVERGIGVVVTESRLFAVEKPDLCTPFQLAAVIGGLLDRLLRVEAGAQGAGDHAERGGEP